MLLLALSDVAYFRYATGNRRAIHAQAFHEYTKKELSAYDGSRADMPVLLAMKGMVYDVSSGRERFYNPGKPYHALAGTDASTLLAIAGGDIIARKYPIVGRLVP